MSENQVLVITDRREVVLKAIEKAVPGGLSIEEYQTLRPNLVRLPDGSWIDRTDVVFLMKQDPTDPTTRSTPDGAVYKTDKNGAMRKVKEVTREERKLRKKLMAHFWRQKRAANQHAGSSPIAQAQ